MPNSQMQAAVAKRETETSVEFVQRQHPAHGQPPDFETLCRLANAQLCSGRLEAALQSIRSALKLKFDFPDGWCVQGRLLMRLHRPEDALRSFNSALSLKPDLIE